MIIDAISKYAEIFPLKDKKVVTITKSFQKTLNKSNSKPSNMWVQRPNETEYRIQKLIKKNGDKLYVMWKIYNDMFNSLIDKNILLCKII